MLTQFHWVCSMIDALENYYCTIAAAKDEIDYLTYEELLSDPVATLQKLATIFDRSITEEAARAIWQKWFDMPAAGPGHRWDPRAEKWKEFIPQRFADRLVGSKLEAAARIFGYTFRREDFRSHSHASEKVVLDHRLIAVEDCRYNVLVGKDIVLSDEGFYAASSGDTGLFASGPAQVRSSIDRLLNSPLTKDVLAAVSVFEFPPELRMEHYVCQRNPAMEVSGPWRAVLERDSESGVLADTVKSTDA